jgi:hydroxyethylthiazole kinase-like uncharacterized protein yjeF
MTLQRLTPKQTHSLWDVASTRRLEVQAAADLPLNTLMQRAGLSIARLVMALRPHAQRVWVACGPGNNGGDGLEAATQLHLRGVNVVVTWAGHASDAPMDSQQAYQRLMSAGLPISARAPEHADVCVDAMLGIGATRGLQGDMAAWAQHMTHLRQQGALVLAADLPSGLHIDTGHLLDEQAPSVHADVTLSLLTLKPGLFTAHGRDVAGEVWLDDLQIKLSNIEQASAYLQGLPVKKTLKHNSHKGSYGDVVVIGGAQGMRGAAMLAACAAMHAGAGRVFVCSLDEGEGGQSAASSVQPELMFRHIDTLDMPQLCVVAGCGGGTAIARHLSTVLQQSKQLVLDADALNAIAQDPALQTLLMQRTAPTVITPHPLEAARLLNASSAQVQQDRLAAAQQLAQTFQCTVVLKGSGTVVSAPSRAPVINPTGNALLARGGTGDVLAGMVGAALASTATSGLTTFEATCQAVFLHGHLADQWPAQAPWSASLLAAAVR